MSFPYNNHDSFTSTNEKKTSYMDYCTPTNIKQNLSSNIL